MTGFGRFEEIEAWQKARQLSNEIYAETMVPFREITAWPTRLNGQTYRLCPISPKGMTETVRRSLPISSQSQKAWLERLDASFIWQGIRIISMKKRSGGFQVWQ